jgi:TPR repeat protein
MKILLLSILLFCTQPALADFAKGVEAYWGKDYPTALKEWQPLAEQGDFSAQYYLGYMYRKGEGVTQDYKTAVKYYTLAAEQEHDAAQSFLGNMYRKGCYSKLHTRAHVAQHCGLTGK